MTLVRRKPLARSKGLKPGKALSQGPGLAHAGGRRRGKALRPQNPARRAARHERDFGELAEVVRTLPCCVAGCRRSAEPAHVVSRGAGGHAWHVVEGVEVGNLAPLCRAHHTGGPGVTRPQHAIGLSQFERENDLVVRLPGRLASPATTLAEVAAEIGRWVKAGAHLDDEGL